jgi:hypothetical protein
MVMMFARPSRAVVTITTGPGSSSRYTRDKGNILFRIRDSFRPLAEQTAASAAKRGASSAPHINILCSPSLFENHNREMRMSQEKGGFKGPNSSLTYQNRSIIGSTIFGDNSHSRLARAHYAHNFFGIPFLSSITYKKSL